MSADNAVFIVKENDHTFHVVEATMSGGILEVAERVRDKKCETATSFDQAVGRGLIMIRGLTVCEYGIRDWTFSTLQEQVDEYNHAFRVGQEAQARAIGKLHEKKLKQRKRTRTVKLT